MVVCELPATREGPALRALVLGSCRVRNPMFTLRNQGLLRIQAELPTPTHTAEEAMQALTIVMGDTDTPAFLDPYIFESPSRPNFDRVRDYMNRGIDVFMLEVSDFRQFSFQGICLNQNFVTRHLVQPYRGALLEWYRQISWERPGREETVDRAIANLQAAGYPYEGEIVDLLRHVRLEPTPEEQIRHTLVALSSRMGGRWVIVGPFAIPGDEGAVMTRRRGFNAVLAEAARSAGALFFDPSQLLVEYGPATALAGGGADVYEYSEAFYPTLGRALVSQMKTVGSRSDRAGFRAAGQSAGEAMTEIGRSAAAMWLEAKARRTRSRARRLVRRVPEVLTGGGGSRRRRPGSALPDPAVTAESINVQLVALHRARLQEFGVSGSGLFAHYERMISVEKLVGIRQTRCAELVAEHFDDYDGYAVLRAGLGELAMLLAAQSRRVVACEPNPLRRRAIEAGIERVAQSGSIEASDLVVSERLTPARPMAGRILGIGLDVVQAKTAEGALPYWDDMQQFSALLIDPRLFLIRRELPQDFDELYESLRGHGFSERRDFPGDSLCWFGRPSNGSQHGPRPESRIDVG